MSTTATRVTLGIVVLAVIAGLLLLVPTLLGHGGSGEGTDAPLGVAGRGTDRTELGRDAPRLEGVLPPARPSIEGRPAATPADGATSPQPHNDVESPGRVKEGDEVSAGTVEGAILDDEGQPLVKALVMLIDDPRVVAQTYTDGNGAFHFHAVDAAQLVLYVRARGWGALRHPVQPGGRRLEVAMDRGPSLGGVVVDAETGLPVPALRILVIGTAGGAALAQTETAEDGTFRVGGLAPGTSFLDLGTRGGQHPGLAADYVVTRVGPFPAGRLDLRIEVARGLAIAGVVRGPDGVLPAESVCVYVVPITPEGHVDFEGTRWTPVAEDGAFRVPGLREGRYDVTVRPKVKDDPSSAGALTRVAGVAAGTLDLVVELQRGVPLEGRLVDEMGEPVIGPGWVWVAPEGVAAGSPGSVAATLDRKGGFRTPPLDPGRAYYVRASGFRGYQEGRRKGIHPGDVDLVVTLMRGARLEGRVRLTTGEPCPAGVPVVASAAGDDAVEVGKKPWAYVRGTTGPNGTFLIGGLKAGVLYTLKAGSGSSGLIPHGRPPTVAAPQKDVTLEVTKGARLRGTLVDAAGNPLASVTLMARPEKGGRTAWTHTDLDGAFVFDGLTPGRVVLGTTIDKTYVRLGVHVAPAADVRLVLEP